MNVILWWKDGLKRIIDQWCMLHNLAKFKHWYKVQVNFAERSEHGEISTNMAMVMAKIYQESPRSLYNQWLSQIENIPEIHSVSFAVPGFINFVLQKKFWHNHLNLILQQGVDYGRTNQGNGEKVNLEFVSANPTGPLHLAHIRGAVVGDILANIMTMCGYDVDREYYINDRGGQINALAQSLYRRYGEVLQQQGMIASTNEYIEALQVYPGKYLIDIARDLVKHYGAKYWQKNWDCDFFMKFAIQHIMDGIKQDLQKLGIKFDIFTSERAIHNTKLLSEAVDILMQQDLLYEGTIAKPRVEKYRVDAGSSLVNGQDTQSDGQDTQSGGQDTQSDGQDTQSGEQDTQSGGQDTQSGEQDTQSTTGAEIKLPKRLLFKSTMFGDDRDRYLNKRDGTWTYFASDIAYHLHKIKRGYKQLIFILGADHSGYMKRIASLTSPLSWQKATSRVYLCQLVKIIKDNVLLKLSKRQGNIITVRDLIQSLGVDATRLITISCRREAPIDIDLQKTQERSMHNPVFYIQYAHARCYSVLQKLLDLSDIKKQLLRTLPQVHHTDDNLREFWHMIPNITKVFDIDLSLLVSDLELDLIKCMAHWPDIVQRTLQQVEPNIIVTYLQVLAARFHGLWNQGKKCHVDRFINADNLPLTMARIALVQGTAAVLRNGLTVLGVGAPYNM